MDDGALPDACPRCGGELIDAHAIRVRVPFEAEVDEDGALSMRHETVAAPAWRCASCRRLVWRDIARSGALLASEGPHEGPIDPPATRVGPEPSGAGAIAAGILLFSVACLLLAMTC
ncbi:MAG: hypothetical protein R3A51_04245 [Nannocystaceae bacterium]|nr:hypothetical protein [Myxococcales bacterium]